ncbi:unnamed protein product [Dibothriocephalus latus]|uniref:Uncharacterized protein n=1 Tax=Dibothriocephalus latus TaxID=60516 RepID=A0A3P7LSF1_DIBLA|nr:unnamed protein product [Dibothriocephalus latus]
MPYFTFKGLIMKVDAFNNIQADTVYRGLQPKHHMTQVMDFFSLPAVYVVCAVIEVSKSDRMPVPVPISSALNRGTL